MKTSQIFRIEEPLEAKYHGCGYAIAAVAGGQLIDLAYLGDLLPDLEIGTQDDVLNALNDPRIAPMIRLFSTLWKVSVGMCSCMEFVEI
jgi:hypothetical protein